jgi:glutamine synthetase
VGGVSVLTVSIAVADRTEAEAFLAAHPDIAFFEVIFTGMSGVPRGKRLRRHELQQLCARQLAAEHN